MDRKKLYIYSHNCWIQGGVVQEALCSHYYMGSRISKWLNLVLNEAQ